MSYVIGQNIPLYQEEQATFWLLATIYLSVLSFSINHLCILGLLFATWDTLQYNLLCKQCVVELLWNTYANIRPHTHTHANMFHIYSRRESSVARRTSYKLTFEPQKSIDIAVYLLCLGRWNTQKQCFSSPIKNWYQNK